MGRAIDTVAFRAVNPGAGGAAATAATGDSGMIRSFPNQNNAWLIELLRAGGTAGFTQVTSPMLCDNVRGIRYTTAENPSRLLIPAGAMQKLTPGDTLAVTISGGAAETDVAALSVYYDNLPGASARLHSWGDISGLIANLKPMNVAVATNATAGQWSDTVITTTENLLDANTDYAVLGFITDVAICALGVKGTETGNLRICGPGSTASDVTSNYFVNMSNMLGQPCIPVFNANNRGGVFVSTLDAAAATSINAQLILAQLSQNLPN